MNDTPAPTSAPADDEQIVFSVYDGDTGAISVRGSCPRSMANIQPRALHEGMIFEFLDANTHYVDVSGEDHVSRMRPQLPGFDRITIKADAVDAATLMMPIAGTASIDGEVHALAAGPFALRVDTPGSYDIIVRAFPYRDLATVVTAIA